MIPEYPDMTPREILKQNGWHPLEIDTLYGNIKCLKIAWCQFLWAVWNSLKGGKS